MAQSYGSKLSVISRLFPILKGSSNFDTLEKFSNVYFIKVQFAITHKPEEFSDFKKKILKIKVSGFFDLNLH